MPKQWMKIAAVVAPIVILLVLLIIFLLRFCSSSKSAATHAIKRTESLQSGIARLHLPPYQGKGSTNHRKNPSTFHHLHDFGSKRKANYYVFKRGLSVKPLFNWSDHPNLVSEAVEHGWPRFAFLGLASSSSSSTRSVLLGLCALGDQGLESEAEISWEVPTGSSEFMQKIKLNSKLKKGVLGTSNLGASSVIRTALPLPGPFLGNSSFPQEAYFEITILTIQKEDDRNKGENEKTKLIQDKATDLNLHSGSQTSVTSGNANEGNGFEELRFGNKEESLKEAVISLGLTIGGILPLKLPGSYPGSIGFNSNGSVYHDGMKLVLEDEKAVWGAKEKVIGCGFDPEQRKVFFTVDSELVHVTYCQTEEFGSPMYPTLASNTNAIVMVNFGQNAFLYAPANGQRTANPCFLASLSLGFEDSKELFSMGRIDSQWHNRSSTNNGDNVSVDIDNDSEAEFFEIMLDNLGRSSATYRNEV